MKLINKPYSDHEKREELDSLKGNISRICVSDDPEEIASSLGFAIDRLCMITYSRIKTLKLPKREARWKGAGHGDYYCSLCCSQYSGGDKYNFCPNCGAQMK